MNRPTCQKCRHFYVTYEPSHPNGCRLFQFVSKQYPSQVVERESGKECTGYTPKQKKQEDNRKMDLNDPKYW